MAYTFNTYQLQEIHKMLNSVGAVDTYREWFCIPRHVPVTNEEVSDFVGDYVLQYNERIKGARKNNNDSTMST